MWIASFDIGIKNFAFAITEINQEKISSFPFTPCISDMHTCFDLIHFENLDLTENAKDIRANNMIQVFRNLYDVLDSFQYLWEQCDVFLIEQQMQFRHASNIKALKLSQHVLAYLIIRHSSKCIQEYPAYHKTQVWNAPAKLKKHERKKWAIDTVQKLMDAKKDGETGERNMIFHDLKKKDDVSDCVLMCLAYAFQKK
jgi:hypothetical protein